MAVSVTVSEDGVLVQLSGLDRVAAFRSEVRIAKADLVSAVVKAREAAFSEVGWRLLGTGAPGLVLAGNFTFRPARRGERQFLAVFRAKEVLVINTALERPRRVTVQHDDRVRLAAEINALIA